MELAIAVDVVGGRAACPPSYVALRLVDKAYKATYKRCSLQRTYVQGMVLKDFVRAQFKLGNAWPRPAQGPMLYMVKDAGLTFCQ